MLPCHTVSPSWLLDCCVCFRQERCLRGEGTRKPQRPTRVCMPVRKYKPHPITNRGLFALCFVLFAYILFAYILCFSSCRYFARSTVVAYSRCSLVRGTHLRTLYSMILSTFFFLSMFLLCSYKCPLNTWQHYLKAKKGRKMAREWMVFSFLFRYYFCNFCFFY